MFIITCTTVSKVNRLQWEHDIEKTIILSSTCYGKLYFCFFCRVRFPNGPLLKAVWEAAHTFLIDNSFPQQKLSRLIIV